MVVEMETGRQGRIIPIEKLREVWPQIPVRADKEKAPVEAMPAVTITKAWPCSGQHLRKEHGSSEQWW